MFRNSDYKDPVPHKAYKATPTLQLLSQASPMDAASFNKYATLGDVTPRAVPVTHAVAYNPEHPDADWNGLVTKSDVGTRRHETDHPSQRSGIAHTEKGIVSVEEKKQWPRKRRDDSVIPVGDSGGKLLGGAGTPDDPYQTNMQLANQGAPTTKDQMTLAKQSQPVVKHSPRGTPGVLSEVDLYKHSSDMLNPVSSTQFAFAKAPAPSSQRAQNRSFISNIGNAMVNDSSFSVAGGSTVSYSENENPKAANKSHNTSGSLW